ncbi:MAG: hypothetical protein IJP90_17170 [Treponema sp.]|nr:hypothetical protein [Treponema sp.]
MANGEVDSHEKNKDSLPLSEKHAELSVATFPKTKLTVLQDKSSFCFGIDAVLLADFASVKNGGKVFDLGTGNGIIPLLMAKTSQASHFTALEIQEKIR